MADINPKSELGLYEGDQSKLYSGVYNHHHDIESSESKTQVRKIWNVTIVLAVITVIEAIVGILAEDAEGAMKTWRNIFFLVLTLIKAGYIVSIFMHLGDEKRNFRLAVLTPLVLFIWFIVAFLVDGNYWRQINEIFANFPLYPSGRF